MYKIEIKQVEVYEETVTDYEAADGKKYTSKYSVPEGVKFEAIQVPTGAKLYKERTIYTQDFEAADLTRIIRAVNGIM